MALIDVHHPQPQHHGDSRFFFADIRANDRAKHKSVSVFHLAEDDAIRGPLAFIQPKRPQNILRRKDTSDTLFILRHLSSIQICSINISFIPLPLSMGIEEFLAFLVATLVEFAVVKEIMGAAFEGADSVGSVPAGEFGGVFIVGVGCD
jgi:hypothetical protein